MKKILLVLATGILFVGCTTTSTEPTTNTTSSSTSSTSSVTTSTSSDAGIKTFTLAEVSTHNTQADCWTTINGKVYDLTSFVGRHPGGAKILQACGVDATQLFTNESEHNATSDAQLAQLYIGDLN